MSLSVEFGAEVPKEEYDRFKRNFPQYGSVKWFINEALRCFNDQVERRPSTVDEVDAAISHQLEVAQQIKVATKDIS